MQNSTSADKSLFEVNSSLRSFDVFGQPFSFVANELVKQIYEQSSATQVWNLYGPTEDTTYSTYALIDKENNGRVPIGRPAGCNKGWSELSTESVEVFTIPGTHFHRPKPAVENLARQLKACIAQADEIEQAIPQFI